LRPDFELLLTVDEVAEIFKFTPQHIRRLAARKVIIGARFGKEWRFRRSDLDRAFREASSITTLPVLETFPVVPPEPKLKRPRGRPTHYKNPNTPKDA
jgi:excisionase family DNA binding protein